MISSPSLISGAEFLKPRRDCVTMAHGGGGQLTDELVQGMILPRLGNRMLDELLDAAVVRHRNQRLAFTIDGYVVQPLKFPGGDIGKLAVCGTVNDLAVMGAKPLGIALGLILAEGLDRALLDEIVDSIAQASKAADVSVVTGDTKVVGRGQGDGMYITTAGIGVTQNRARVHPSYIEPGDAIIINGPIADHGLAVMLAREMPEMKSALRSDVAPLNHLIEMMLKQVPGLNFMRDPTRGGVSGLLADVAARTGWHIRLDESQIPVRPETRHAAEMLGLDPLDVANEGKVLFFVRPFGVERAMKVLREHEAGQEATVIGHVESPRDGICELVTLMGGRRIVQKPYGEQLPRIC